MPRRCQPSSTRTPSSWSHPELAKVATATHRASDQAVRGFVTRGGDEMPGVRRAVRDSVKPVEQGRGRASPQHLEETTELLGRERTDVQLPDGGLRSHREPDRRCRHEHHLGHVVRTERPPGLRRRQLEMRFPEVRQSTTGTSTPADGLERMTAFGSQIEQIIGESRLAHQPSMRPPPDHVWRESDNSVGASVGRSDSLTLLQHARTCSDRLGSSPAVPVSERELLRQRDEVSSGVRVVGFA